jgi:hypothetical protein
MSNAARHASSDLSPARAATSVRELVARTVGPAIGVANLAPVDWSGVDSRTLLAYRNAILVNRLYVHVLQGAQATKQELPGNLREIFENYQRHATLSGTSYLQTARLLAPAFAAAGVRAVFYKGALGHQALYGNYFMKHATDTDVLVAQGDYDRAGDLLAANGFHLEPACASVWWRGFLGEQHFNAPVGRGLLSVDLHLKTKQPGCPGPRDRDYFVARAIPSRVGSVEVLTLDLVRSVMMAAISLGKALSHHEAGGRYAADVAAGLSRCTPAQLNELVDEARRQGLERALSLAVAVCGLMFDMPTPRQIPVAPDIHALLVERDIVHSLLNPDDPAATWPRRTRLQWLISDEKPAFLKEFAWKFLSDWWQRAFERDADKRGRPAVGT